ncbi:MAG: branched chain amino acid aminotransferase [Bacteroidetes bacterium HGW-Bacteroidetes-6]|jgi:branched-chain amino acid aminotransferase|nr:MAG: branched chain amino acid aminotransferase [Bacteroidetes bacterium HGW-Bacteroidetes-6]
MENIEWSKLPFGYRKTAKNVRTFFKNGTWSKPEISDSEYINIHMAATGLHYGQQAFEGMKAYRGKNGDIRLFRWDENAKRLQRSAKGIYMAEVPDDIFFECVKAAVLENIDFLPPYGTGASLYLRPLLFGSGPEVGVKPSSEYTFIVFATPVGPYFKEGFNPVKIAIIKDSDRAAPLGTGTIKVGGNYAASLRGVMKAHDHGFGSPMYLDAKEKRYIDEIGAANFFGIKDNTYITPSSSSILPSITNKSLQILAEDLGLKVDRRPVPIDELASFEEVGACGTAAIIAPIGLIEDVETGEKFEFCKDGKAGKWSTALYQKLMGIQYGDEPDTHNWITVLS